MVSGTGKGILVGDYNDFFACFIEKYCSVRLHNERLHLFHFIILFAVQKGKEYETLLQMLSLDSQKFCEYFFQHRFSTLYPEIIKFFQNPRLFQALLLSASRIVTPSEAKAFLIPIFKRLAETNYVFSYEMKNNPFLKLLKVIFFSPVLFVIRLPFPSFLMLLPVFSKWNLLFLGH